MFIKRVTVEEGFLHGLDLRLDRGLSVLVGARGTGKTSVIELIRFCLNVPSYTEARGTRVPRQALEVLGSGKVTVTLDADGTEVVFSRSAEERVSRRSSDVAIAPPIVLSQNEIEQVGYHPDSRVRLLDSFVPSLQENERSEDAARALIASLTVELRNVLVEARAAEDEVARLAGVPDALIEARRKATEASAHLEQTTEERRRLDDIGHRSAAADVRLRLYDRAVGAIGEWVSRVDRFARGPKLDVWPAAARTEDRLADVREHVNAAEALVQDARSRLELAIDKARQLHHQEEQTQIELEDEARTLRTHIDQLSEGAGALMKRVSDLEILEQRAEALRERVGELRRRADAISARREKELDRLDALREARVNAREEAAQYLNGKLGPRIRISVNRFGSVAAYAQALAETLRGSGVQYNVLAPELAETISPRELATAAERGDAETVASIAGITLERAQRVVNHLREVGTELILTAPLGDTVQLALLDGGRYKPAEELSVGQRCTVVLPIVLSHTERVLIVDQPEDNLDNKFIVETLVKALRGRPRTAQFLFATHNPNVPVLGDADLVIYMTSDGKRADIAHAGALDDRESVRAITDVMEGGQQAFDERAAFYSRDHA